MDMNAANPEFLHVWQQVRNWPLELRQDLIVQINRAPITRAEDVNRILTSYGRGMLQMYFERGGQIYATEFSLQ